MISKTIKCQFCKRNFIPKYHPDRACYAKFCSRACYDMSRLVRRKCRECNEDITAGKSNKYFCSQKCYHLFRSKNIGGALNPRYGGEKIVDGDGYVRIYIGYKKKRGYEHRIILENVLNRKLKDNEVVHHINGIKNDNRNCNLLVCSNRYHNELHQKMAYLYQQEHFIEPYHRFAPMKN